MMTVSQAAVAMDKEMNNHHGQWWGSAMRAGWRALAGSPVDGVDAATSAWTANLCGKTLGKDLSQEEERQ